MKLKKKLLMLGLVFGLAAAVVGMCDAGAAWADETKGILPENPIHYCIDESGDTDTSDWSYISFGSYPKTEIEVDALTAEITDALYDENGDAWINGVKYRRISKWNANSAEYFGNNTYRYFKWESIRWRVLKNDGSTLFVMADWGLDCKDYNESFTSVTWENSTIRRWLNNSFYNTAFNSDEQEAIVEQEVVNEDNPYYGIESGNNTKDKIYLLSYSEAIDSNYGFCENRATNSTTRRFQTSDYAYAMGAWDNANEKPYEVNCWWWLRTAGGKADWAQAVNNFYGYVDYEGSNVNYCFNTVIPVLHIDLSSECWSIEEKIEENINPIFSYVELTNGTIEITGCKEGEEITELVIPAEIDGKEVTGVGDEAFNGWENLTSVKLPDTLTYIGSSAFSECRGLTGIKIPDTVTCIKNSAFKKCTGLQRIEIGDSIQFIGKNAFSETEWLSNRLKENSFVIISGILINGNNATGHIEIPDSVKAIGAGAFEYCDELTDIIIPNTVQSIEEEAFYECSSLESIEIPSSVTSIGEYTFDGCSSLVKIEIPDSVASIEKYAFNGCSSLESIEIPGSVTSIGEAAFKNCNSLKSIEIPSSVTSIGEYTFDGCSSLVKIEIPGSVTSIGEAAFKDCNSLESIEIPSSVTSIGEYTFDGCSSLVKIEIPDSVASIGKYAFNGCSSLESIEIPGSVTSIGEAAFKDCNSLKSIEIPSLVTSIEDLTFESCSSLTSVKIPDQITSIGVSAFRDCSNLRNIEIPSKVTFIGAGAFAGTQWRNDKIEETPLVIVNGILIYGGAVAGDIKIPDTVTVIGDDAFMYHSGLTSIKIPDTVTAIGENAFYCCQGLTSIQIPNSIVTIGEGAFESCYKLKDVYFNESEARWQEITILSDNDSLTTASIHFNASMPERPDSSNADGNNNNSASDDKDINRNENTTTALGKLNVFNAPITYSGKAQIPEITVTDANGQVVVPSNYTVTYSDNTNVGQAIVTVIGKGNYTGTLTATFDILPKGTNISKLNARNKSFVVKWKKQKKETTGYQIQYSANKNFKDAKSITVKKNKTVSATVKKLKANKKYFVRIRTYKTAKINGKYKKLYSGWSKVKTVVTKK